MNTKKYGIGTAVLLVVAMLLGAKTSADPVNATTVQSQASNANPQTPPPPIVQNAGDPPTSGPVRICVGC